MSVMPNPLIAARQDTTTAWSGIFLAEDIEGIIAGFESGSWIEVGIGGFAASMDTLAFVFDPLGQIVAWGVAWLMEHVKPLSDALDMLAGDPDQIAAYAQTWHNVAAAVEGAGAELRDAVDRDTVDWWGATADAYRNHAGEHLAALQALRDAASAIGSIVEGAGLVVALVRGLVRDLIAEFVGVLAVRIWEWLAEEACTLGLATPLVVAQVTSLVAKWVGRIAHLLHGLVNSIRRLVPILKRLDEIIKKLSELLRRLRRAATGGPRRPSTPDTPARPSTPDGPSGSGGPPGSGGQSGPGGHDGSPGSGSGGPPSGSGSGGPSGSGSGGPSGSGGTPDGPPGSGTGGPPGSGSGGPGAGGDPTPPRQPDTSSGGGSQGSGGGPPPPSSGGPPRPHEPDAPSSGGGSGGSGGGPPPPEPAPPRDPDAPPPPEAADVPGGDGTPTTLAESTHPGISLGELGDDFLPGVTDPGDLFLPKERSIAEYLAEHGMNVEKVPEVHDVDGLTNPDSIVRRSPDDPGVITEMKTLDSGSSTAVKDNIIDAGRQVEQHGGGHAVIDGRGVDLTEEDARRGFARAVGQARVHGQDMPEQVHFILGNGQLLTLPEI